MDHDYHQFFEGLVFAFKDVNVVFWMTNQVIKYFIMSPNVNLQFNKAYFICSCLF